MPERSNVTLRRVRKQKRVDLTRGHGQQRAGTVATPVAERKALRMAGTVARPVAERKALRRSRRAERCTERLARTNDSTEGLKAVGTAAADGHIAHLRQQPQALDIATAARQGVPRKRAAAQVADADAPRAAAHPQGLPSRLDQACSRGWKNVLLQSAHEENYVEGADAPRTARGVEGPSGCRSWAVLSQRVNGCDSVEAPARRVAVALGRSKSRTVSEPGAAVHSMDTYSSCCEQFLLTKSF